MALPDTKSLDYAWIKTGVFCYQEAKNLNTGSLDFACSDGIFTGFWESLGGGGGETSTRKLLLLILED